MRLIASDDIPFFCKRKVCQLQRKHWVRHQRRKRLENSSFCRKGKNRFFRCRERRAMQHLQSLNAWRSITSWEKSGLKILLETCLRLARPYAIFQFLTKNEGLIFR